MENKLHDDYRIAVYKALEKCQFIQEILREYLYLAAEIAKIKLAPYLSIHITKDQLSKLPLGKLIYYFSLLNNDESFCKELGTITQKRNYVAHSSLLFSIGELWDEVYMKKALADINEITELATKIHETLLEKRISLIKYKRKVQT